MTHAFQALSCGTIKMQLIKLRVSKVPIENSIPKSNIYD